MMKHIYLILAHKCPEQISRLIRSLKYENTFFVIHIDAKVNIEDYKKFSTKEDMVHFLPDRTTISWGSYGIIEATLSMILYVKKNFDNVDRVTLLSGQDYPIKSSEFINDFFCKNTDAIFLNYFRLPYKDWFEGGVTRFPNFYRIDKFVQIHGGSQWWSMPFNVADYLLKFLDENPFYEDYFKTVVIPDESFFQSLLINIDEPFIKNNLVNDNLRYIKWEPPYTHPSTLTVSDLSELNTSGSLFARKFDYQIDKRVLKLLDASSKRQDDKTIYFNREKPKSQTFLFLTNKDEPAILNNYESFRKEVITLGRSNLLFHCENDNYSEQLLNLDPIRFDDTILTSLKYTPILNQLVPGNNHFPLFQFYLKNKNVDYYWVVEDDVRFNGKWSAFFETLSPEKISSDFLATNFAEFGNQPLWYWWDSLVHPRLKVQDIYKVRSFNPIYRISKRALDFLHRCLLDGWSGHHEVLIPTLLLQNGFSVNDIGGENKYSLGGFKSKLYDACGPDLFGGMSNGSMRFRPVTIQSEMTNSFLYHPVKNS